MKAFFMKAGGSRNLASIINRINPEGATKAAVAACAVAFAAALLQGAGAEIVAAVSSVFALAALWAANINQND